MLKKCAPGYRLIPGKHLDRIVWNGLVFPALPKGAHGKRSGRGEVQRPIARKLIRDLGIEDCAKAEIAALR